ncbi:MAG: hypothetical protein J5564_06355 [Clostridia bacterium]|nr:hypothetical protein [Clostridia bacterium]
MMSDKPVRIRPLLLLVLCTAIAVLALPALATGISGNDQILGTAQDSRISFHAYPYQNTTLLFMPYQGVAVRQNGQQTAAYGLYIIDHYVNGQYSETVRVTGGTVKEFKMNAYERHDFQVLSGDLYFVQCETEGGGAGAQWLWNQSANLTYKSWYRAAGWYVSCANAQISYNPIYGGGIVTATPQPWYYTATPQPWYYTATPQPWITAAPAGQSVAVQVKYMTPEGTLLGSETRMLYPGTQVVSNTKSFYGYSLVGNGSQTVTVYQNGATSPANIIFYFAKNSGYNPVTQVPYTTPSPNPYAQTVRVTVQAMTTENTPLDVQTFYLTAGTHTMTAPRSAYTIYGSSDVYMLIGSASRTITVYANGQISENPVIFYYASGGSSVTATPTPAGSAATDQKATISAKKIYPRPGPNVGKNEYNYEVQGQTVTVHSKAKDQKGGNDWWICFSGALRCEGKVYNLDHMWISEQFFDSRSYNINALPIDPQYNK